MYLNRNTLNQDDIVYIANEKTHREEILRLERGFYEDGMEDGREEGREEGIIAGIEEGTKNKAIEIARLMKSQGEPIDKIFLYSGLTKDEIKKL